MTPMSIGGGDATGGVAPSPTSSFATRTDAGKVVHSLQVELGKATSIPAVGVRLDSRSAGGSLPGGSHMWERLDERARLMDGMVESLEKELIEMYGAKAEVRRQPDPRT